MAGRYVVGTKIPAHYHKYLRKCYTNRTSETIQRYLVSYISPECIAQDGINYLELTQPFHYRLTLRRAAVLGLYFECNSHDYAPWKCKQFDEFGSEAAELKFYTYSFAAEMHQPLEEAVSLMGATITELLQEIIEDMCLPKNQMVKKRQHWLRRWEAVSAGTRSKVQNFLLPITEIEFPNIAAICAKSRGLLGEEAQCSTTAPRKVAQIVVPAAPIGFVIPTGATPSPVTTASTAKRLRALPPPGFYDRSTIKGKESK